MTKDYIAVVFVGTGSSWARGDNKEEVAKRVMRNARKEWGDFYDFGSVKPRKVHVWDVTGFDKLWWDFTGMYPEGSDKAIDTHEYVEIEGGGNGYRMLF